MKLLFSKRRWWIEMMGITYLLSLNLLVILMASKYINYVEHWGEKNPKPAKPVNPGCQMRMGLESRSLLREPAVIPAVCSHEIALGLSFLAAVAVLSQKERSLLVRRYQGLHKISLLISSSPQSHIEGRADRAAGVTSSPGELPNWYVQHHICLLKDLLV